MKLSLTGTLALVFLIGALAGGIWWFNGGAVDGAKVATYVCLGIAALLAIASRVLGGAWFTDNSGGR